MFDLHVHSPPCVFTRRADDVETVSWYEQAGLAGCVLKEHYYGGLVLNEPADGFNPSAVAAALALGTRVIWMPTLDARAHREAGLPRPDNAGSASYAEATARLAKRASREARRTPAAPHPPQLHGAGPPSFPGATNGRCRSSRAAAALVSPVVPSRFRGVSSSVSSA